MHVGDGHYINENDERFSDDGAQDPAQLTVDQLTVASLLRRLSDRHRRVVTHLYLLGGEPEQLARFLGVSANNLRQIALRARRHARALLTESETDDANNVPV